MAGLVIGLSPVKVEVRFRGSEKLSISELLIRINELAEEIGSKVVIAIDEAQELRRVNWLMFDKLVAYAYDNLRYVNFVLTGHH